MAVLVKKAYADLRSGQQIHYRYVLPSTSAQDIPIVYLHKSASSSASYVKLMSHYAKQGYAGYAPDMPGFGQSFDPTQEDVEAIHARGTAWYTDVFLFVFEQLGLRRFHVIGHHSGASLANQLAATQADRVASLCLIGATIIGFEERQKMKERFLKPFNQPTHDGSHLMKTWDYLGNMGLPDGCDLDLKQREAIDHIRAWRGRNLIYGAVWDQDSEELFQVVKCPVLVLCAEDDVLWYHMDNVTRVKPAAQTKTIAGANFSLDLDVDGIVREWDAFQDNHHPSDK
ncbi:alpha/beta-hydrolase [Teratosphaeria nubilosa]|uniref:Alpha/beta-hydrolase n=1 Tax=Teratosphaeria nubilosa TaxID=161662 RepID=A0A6G1LC09_9PEZI|nr:alpha/beta-hydrolase [Teratosphaeria nubilosa]